MRGVQRQREILLVLGSKEISVKEKRMEKREGEGEGGKESGGGRRRETERERMETKEKGSTPLTLEHQSERNIEAPGQAALA